MTDESRRKADEELFNYLEKDDLLEFERGHELVSSIWHNQATYSLPEVRNKSNKVECQPPVKLFVGKIPQGLTKQGLRNVFCKFGNILEVDIIRSKDFGFVTFCTSTSAGEAISQVHDSPPLFLTVKYAKSDQTRQEEAGLARRVGELRSKLDSNSNQYEVVEDDWDKEIEEEEKMFESLDKFREDYNSSEDDDEILASAVKTNPGHEEDIEVKCPCKRCGKESSFHCSKCKQEKYCSQACQGLDWPRHKKVCKLTQMDKTELEQSQGSERSHEEISTSDKSRSNNINSNETCSEQESDKVSVAENKSNLWKMKVIENFWKENVLQSFTIDDARRDDPYVQSLTQDNVNNSNHSDLEGPRRPQARVAPKVCFQENLPPNTMMLMAKEEFSAQILDQEGNWAMIRIWSGPFGFLEYSKVFHENLRELTSVEVLDTPPVTGQLLLGPDGKCYRVVVDEVFEDGKINVRGIDIVLNLNYSSYKKFHHFPASLLKFPAQCQTVRLQKEHKLTKDDIGSMVGLKVVGMKKNYPLVEIVAVPVSQSVYGQKPKPNNEPKTDQNTSSFEIHAESKNLLSSFKSKASSIESKGDSKTVASRSKLFRGLGLNDNPQQCKLELGLQQVFIVHVESPDEVYVTPDIEKLKQFQKFLYKTGSNLDPDPSFVVSDGDQVIARSASDGYWYRATVRECVRDKVTFFCPDFGFVEKVRITEIREVGRDLAKVMNKTEFLACKCVLMDWRKGTEQPNKEEVKEFKKKMKVSGEAIDVNVVDKEDDKYVIDVKYLVRV